jgi:outer membrane receptor protein involved in Fe transport
MKYGHVLPWLIGVNSLAVAAAVAQAQSNTAPAQKEELGEIVVTGSRVVANGNDSPTPVTVVTTEQMLAVSPTTVVDTVNLMPALQGSQSTSSNPGGGQRNGAAAYINLRAMGDLRTLVLMDGHRVVPTINQNQGNVDAWVIPQLLIQRVDVVTGGVSAVYGSDAVSGVVNFITDTHFSGFKVQASSGMSTYHDDRIFDFGAAFGTSVLGGRGHVEFSGQYHNDPGILDQSQRPFFAQSLGGGGLGTAASPYYNVTDQRISNASFGGLITSGPLNGLQFAQVGAVSTFNPGTATGTANVSSGGDGAWYKTASIKSALSFKQLFGRFDYDFTDNTHGYLQLSGTRNHTQNSFRSPLESVSIGYNNPYLNNIQQPYQAQLQAQAALTPNGSFTFRKLMAIPGTANQWTDTFMAMGGIDGSIGKYKWNVGFQHSSSQIKAENEVNVDQGKFLAASNAVLSGGQIVCRAALTNANYSNCVPINLFGPAAESQAAMDYILAVTWNKNRTTLDELDASFTGAPLSTWAGPVNMALSAEWRQMGWSVNSNAGPNDPIDCNGVQFGCTGSGLSQTPRWLQNTMPGLPKVTQNVSELAYETDVPLAKDLRFVKAFDLNAAARFTNYSTSGSVWTYKLGAIWHMNDDLTLRATGSRDIRAPNLFELNAPTTIAPTTITDPLTKTAGSVGVATVSNANLTPEKANSLTGGFIWAPHFVSGFSLSVDAFRVTVSNAISQLAGQSPSVLQLCIDTAGANPACNVIVRPLPYSNTTSANFPTALYQKWLNIASFKTYGVDVEANYDSRVKGHALTLRALASYQPHLIFDQGPAGVIDLGDTAFGVNLYPASPSVKYTLIGQFGITDNFLVSLMQRGRNSMKVVSVAAGQTDKVLVHPYDPSIGYTNLTLSYTMGSSASRTELYANVQNLFNKAPDVYYAGANSSPGVGLTGFFPPNGDDIVGRYYTLGFRYRH